LPLQDIGDGWWEGELENGETGLFPESYVELVSDGVADGYPQSGMVAQEEHQQNYGGDLDDQQWDEDDNWDETGQDGFDEQAQAPPREVRTGSVSPSQQSAQMGRAGTVRKNINRFSPFVKTGSESFVLGRVSVRTQLTAADRVKIVLSPENTPMWEPNPDPYTVEVRDPEKKKKFRGMKTFTAYHIVPSSTGRPVSRRYKHYDWLHDRLEEKFTVNCVPPLPDKQYYGRYGEDFIQKRREKLESWSNRIARHPVLSRSDVISHFFLCDGEGAQWKAGKRRAEKDELVGAAFLTSIELPDVTVDMQESEAKVEAFGLFLRSMKSNLSKMRVKFIDHCNQMSGRKWITLVATDGRHI